MMEKVTRRLMLEQRPEPRAFRVRQEFKGQQEFRVLQEFREFRGKQEFRV